MDPAKRPSFVRIHDRLNEFLSSYSRDPENSNTLRVDVAFADSSNYSLTSKLFNLSFISTSYSVPVFYLGFSELGRSLSDAVLKSPPSFKPVPTKFFQVQKEKDDAKVSE